MEEMAAAASSDRSWADLGKRQDPARALEGTSTGFIDGLAATEGRVPGDV